MTSMVDVLSKNNRVQEKQIRQRGSSVVNVVGQNCPTIGGTAYFQISNDMEYMSECRVRVVTTGVIQSVSLNGNDITSQVAIPSGAGMSGYWDLYALPIFQSLLPTTREFDLSFTFASSSSTAIVLLTAKYSSRNR